MKDLLILKFNAQSKSTVEGYIGYFMVKRNGEIKYKVLQYPLSFSSLVKLDLNEPFRIFQKNLNDLIIKVTRNSPEIKSMNSNLNRYISRKIVKEPSFGMKLISAHKMKEDMLIKDFIKDFFEDWVSDLNLKVSSEELYYSELSKQFSKYSTPEDITSMLSRTDLNDLSEAYPIVDPIHGRPVSSFDIGTRIYFTVLKFSNEEDKKKIIEAFPNSFNESGENVKPLIGVIISKELANASRDFILIKIECEGVLFKSVVYSGVNIMWESVPVPKAKDEEEFTTAFSKEEKEKLNELLKEKEKIKFSDILIAMFLVVGIVLAIVVGIYFLFWK
ncbi:DUF4899 domain-containing protein [Mesoaciditoga lauensis]|uniref:DUF4899 domain-containing protein n=1 Tax=Mesoaciditoga lauensis TaxID=1495039 RepID=UPI000560F365|nr:DUF4899 domain-containing protein [Mesoaciditoga lauensis]